MQRFVFHVDLDQFIAAVDPFTVIDAISTSFDRSLVCVYGAPTANAP